MHAAGVWERVRGGSFAAETNLSRLISGKPVMSEGLTSVRQEEIPKQVRDDTEVISSAIKKGLTPLVTELMQSLHAYEINNNEEVSRLYISGGGARLRNIDSFLSSELHMDVEHFRIPDEFLQKLQVDEGAGLTLSTGIGLALCGARKKHTSGINFRKGEQISRKESNVNTGRIVYIIAAIITVIILGFADFYSNVRYREERYDAVKAEMRKVFMETFPETRNLVDENQQFKSSVEEMNCWFS